MMETNSIKPLVPTYQTTSTCHNSENNNLHIHCSKSSAAHIVSVHLVTLKNYNYRQELLHINSVQSVMLKSFETESFRLRMQFSI
jgi:hypothetical protein